MIFLLIREQEKYGQFYISVLSGRLILGCEVGTWNQTVS